MKDSIIKWGIIGCGDVTEVKSGPALQKVPNSRLIAVMRRNAEKAKDYAARHGVKKWYSDASELIHDPEVNAIYVATPPVNHEDYTEQALRAGKPVYVEKPMALNAEAAKRMLTLAKQTGVKLSVAHYRREQPLFLKIKELLQQKVIGETRMVNLQFFRLHNSETIAKTEDAWRLNPALSGGGLFHDLAPHQLDLMLYYFGIPSNISGLSFNAAGLYEAADMVSGQMLFEGPVLFNGVWSFTSSQNRDSVEIIGTTGSIRFSVFDHEPLLLIKDGKQTAVHFDRLQHVQEPMIKKVVEYFLDQSTNPCSAEEGFQLMKMMEEMTDADNN